jgi:hypothetical protein
MIEQHNPQIQFDWTRILKGQPEPGEVQERRERPRPDSGRRAPIRQAPPPVMPNDDAVASREPLVVHDSLPDTPTPVHDSLPDTPPGGLAEEVEGAAGASDLIESDEMDELEAPPPPRDDGPVTAAHARLGSEGVSRLRARYADIMAGITDRIHDADRAAELKSQAERLNPDCWVTEDEVRQGLEQYEAVFDSLRSVVGRRRRRRRR